MQDLYQIIESRRDTRHFTNDLVPQEVIDKAIKAGHYAPSVGLTDATRYYVIDSEEIKREVKMLFDEYHLKAAQTIDSEEQKESYLNLKLEAIVEAPLGLVIAYDRSVLDSFTIGTVGSNEAIKFSSVCAAQNIWLSLTEQGYSMGWVSIINYHAFKKLIGLPDHVEPLGYFCIGKPATDYGNQPMLQQLNWKKKKKDPAVFKINNVNSSSINLKIKQSGDIHKEYLFKERIQKKIDQKTKPEGALGRLEELALQIGTVFRSENPIINKPYILVFAADHGIATHGVSAYPQEVTRQMVVNFLEGGAAINVFCKQNGLSLAIIDAGVNYDFPIKSKLINKKIGKGTQSFLHAPAMSISEKDECFEYGAEVVEDIFNSGSNCVGFGEMGIGNTSSASVLMSVLLNLPIEDCVGKGTGVVNQALERKIAILKIAIERAGNNLSFEEKIAYFGGYEILQMAGGMLQAYQRNMLILVDGFISSLAFLIAFKKSEKIIENAIFCHCSEEKAHKTLLEYFKAAPVINLKMRLGEGTGCAVAFPVIQSAVTFLNEMASFETAGVSNK